MYLLSNYPESRYRHCYSVGKKMYHYAKNVLGKDESFCIEMFALGNMHDIGYEFSSDAFGHDIVLANSLMGSFKYYNEIKYHSKLQSNYDSLPMRLLYYADSTVDGNGNWCTYEERLHDIATRYGLNSIVYAETLAIINHVKNLGFNDLL